MVEKALELENVRKRMEDLSVPVAQLTFENKPVRM
jgi:hypothetical protein